MTRPAPHHWLDTQGAPLTCREKLRVLDAELQDLAARCQDALDDAVLMGCSAAAYRAALQEMVMRLEPSVKERG